MIGKEQFLRAASSGILKTNLAYALKIEFVKNPEFAKTDGKKVWVPDPKIEGHSKTLHLFNHELVHVLFGHIERGRNIVPPDKFHWWVWNLACDLTVSRVLEDVYYRASSSYHYIANRLLELQPKEPRWSIFMEHLPLDAPTEAIYRWLLEQNLRFEEKETPFGKILKATIKLKNKKGEENEYTFTVFEFDKFGINKDVENRTGGISIETHRKLFAGNLPLGFELEWKLAMEGGINLERELEKYLKTFASVKGDDVSFLIPNKKIMALGYPVHLPTRVKRKVKALVAVDTSGSISKHELSKFLSVLYKVSDRLDMDLIFCDAEIHQVVRLMDYSEEHMKSIIRDIKPKGGGGTSYEPVFNYYFEHQRKYELLIYFTDLQCFFPEKHPPRILWVVEMNVKTYNWWRDCPYGKIIWV